MNLLDEINQCPDGAKFLRADLHIHSYGSYGSYDVTDQAMTPQGIVDLAISENIKVISITDHNEIGNVQATLEYSKGKPILVIPGIELSTSDGHLLIYCPDFDSLRAFYGKLSISADKKMCNHNIVYCLEAVAQFGGFGVCAHIELGSGFEEYMHGYTPFKEAVLRHRALLGLEISSISSENWFTDRDAIAERRHLINQRRETLGEDSTYEIAKLMSSDAHNIGALGRNAAGDRKITRLKMDQPDFSSFKIALQDPTARVRLEEKIPKSIPCFVGVKFDGGILNGQTIKLSKNLTCIIGGRGAGKSTVLESIRAASGSECRSGLIDNEVWPDRISLVYEDETGRQQVFIKDKCSNVINTTDPNTGISSVVVESFGQGETADTIQHCDKDPSILMKFFDCFIDFGSLLKEDEDLRQELLENQTLIERLSTDIASIPQFEGLKKNADQQIEALKANNAAEVVEIENSLAIERSLRKDLVENLNNLLKSMKSSLSDKTALNLILNFDATKITTGQAEFQDVRAIIESFSTVIDGHALDLNNETLIIREQLKEKLDGWKNKEAESQNRVEAIRKDIEAKGGKLDIGFIRKVAQDSSYYASQIQALYQKKQELDEHKKTRSEQIQRRKSLKEKIHNLRYEFVHKVNENLKATVTDLRISVKLSKGNHSPETATLIKEVMGWRTSQVPRADLIVKSFAHHELHEVIIKQKKDALIGLEVTDGVAVFSGGDAEAILANLVQPHILHRLERCCYEDVVTISLTKSFKENGEVKHIVKDFSKLSLGQQQSILLSILLSSNRTCPLLIDQPEDNLDSEFIYKTLVKNLRRVKEQRQVIIVTHNANIAVLGDAELIVPLKSTSEKTSIMDRGSIDNSATKQITCAILEGGERAFTKRKEIYGI